MRKMNKYELEEIIKSSTENMNKNIVENIIKYRECYENRSRENEEINKKYESDGLRIMRENNIICKQIREDHDKYIKELKEAYESSEEKKIDDENEKRAWKEARDILRSEKEDLDKRSSINKELLDDITDKMREIKKEIERIEDEREYEIKEEERLYYDKLKEVYLSIVNKNKNKND